MKQNFIKSMLVSGLVAVSLQANATGFNKTVANAEGKVMSSSQFYDVLAMTKSEQVATKFGFPDQILTLKTPSGEMEGVVWVYKNAVQETDGLKDARFAFLQGEMKYVAISGQADTATLSTTVPINTGKLMTSDQFDTKLAGTKSEQVATKFGFPDQILTLKTPSGEMEGVVWVYKNAVQKVDGIKDARFVFVQGEVKYVALSNAA